MSDQTNTRSPHVPASTTTRQSRPRRSQSLPRQQGQHNLKVPRSSLFSTAIGAVVNPVLDGVDIDGVVQRVDFNEVVSKIDWNAIVDEIDFNNLLDKIDLDVLIDKLDVNRVVDRVDVNAVLERSNLKQIIARSTSGMFSIVINRFRAICIKVDQIVQRTGRCAWCCCDKQKRKWTLPPKPTVRPLGHRKEYLADVRERKAMKCPKKSTLLAQAVQGRNAGTFSRFLAYAIDKGLTLAFAMLLILVVNALIALIPKEISDEAVEAVSDGNLTSEEAAILTEQEQQEDQARFLVSVGIPLAAVNLCAFVFDALFMITLGSTIGKGFMGLTVIDSRNGKIGHVTIYQAILRSFLTNILTFFFVWIATIFSLIREDRRGLADLLCGTTIIYAWDAKSYRMATDEMSREDQFGGLDFASMDFGGTDDLESQAADYRYSTPATKSTPPMYYDSRQQTGMHNRSGVKSRAVRASGVYHA
ncbi:expressed unknown protein [Seminavis robusta]|uniref:RDD domain-containing protein n=1 Tax=Seminavis robusta TaxID=568900 RepID=A0A9N8E1T3_9STRA|nr:expressed unknown protein [Seminavis robusta]|eukprot:Sro471_g149770.1 n/a (473) ;mRNA; f:51962-53505